MATDKLLAYAFENESVSIVHRTPSELYPLHMVGITLNNEHTSHGEPLEVHVGDFCINVFSSEEGVPVRLTIETVDAEALAAISDLPEGGDGG